MAAAPRGPGPQGTAFPAERGAEEGAFFLPSISCFIFHGRVADDQLTIFGSSGQDGARQGREQKTCPLLG